MASLMALFLVAALGTSPEGGEVVFLRGTSEILEDFDDVGVAGRCDELVVHGGVLDLAFDPCGACVGYGFESRGGAVPRVGRHCEVVSIEEATQGFDAAALGLDDVPEQVQHA